MFGRGREAEVLTPPQLSPEEEANLIEAARARIQEVDGTEYLDGYKLPPDNDELWNPRTFNVSTYRIHKSPWGELYVSHDTHSFESDIQNRKIREANIEAIAKLGHPLFAKPEERDEMVRALYAEHETYTDKIRKAARNLIEKVKN